MSYDTCPQGEDANVGPASQFRELLARLPESTGDPDTDAQRVWALVEWCQGATYEAATALRQNDMPTLSAASHKLMSGAFWLNNSATRLAASLSEHPDLDSQSLKELFTQLGWAYWVEARSSTFLAVLVDRFSGDTTAARKTLQESNPLYEFARNAMLQGNDGPRLVKVDVHAARNAVLAFPESERMAATWINRISLDVDWTREHDPASIPSAEECARVGRNEFLGPTGSIDAYTALASILDRP